MDTTDTDEALQAVAHAHALIEVRELDYLRALNDAAQIMSLEKLARRLGGTTSELASDIARARRLKPIPEGFDGASPFELCQRYAGGELTEAELLDQLSRWDYATLPQTRVPTIAVVPGSLQDLDRARRRNLISDQLYKTAIEQHH